MRNLMEVLNELLDCVNASEPINTELVKGLERLRVSLSYAAPELHCVYWDETHKCLLSNVGVYPKDELGWKLYSIFSTKSIEELKHDMGQFKDC